jgi:hypothetical protein
LELFCGFGVGMWMVIVVSLCVICRFASMTTRKTVAVQTPFHWESGSGVKGCGALVLADRFTPSP